MSNTAVIIVNYNMPERTDALVEHILDTVKVPYQLIVVDNGSDLVNPSQYTTLHLFKNRQTTGGFIAGMEFAELMDREFDYYWLLITSSEFLDDDRDPLEILVGVMEDDPLAYAVSPAFTFNTSAWEYWMEPRGDEARRVFGVDYLAVLIDRKKLKQIGGFRSELPLMWGVIGECNMLARKQDWHIYVHDGYVMHKETNIGYDMNRMNMSAKDRARIASRDKKEILTRVYGEDFESMLRHAYRETEDGDY